MPEERLQKILARAGVASRRACEELVAEGHVSVDGETVTEPGTKADPETQDIRIDGRRVRSEPHEYWLLNKPKGVVCTNYDPAGRRRPIDLVTGSKARLFPVGRLDAASKGLLLMTNDGEFANRLTHPRYGVPKTYIATVGGKVTGRDVQRLLRGMHVAEGKARVARVRVLKRGSARSALEITLREGRNRQIRRMLAALRHPVRDLVRTRIGRIGLRGLGPGRSRRLTPGEVEYLRGLGEEAPKTGRPARQTRKKGRPGAGAPSRGAAKAPSYEPGRTRAADKPSRPTRKRSRRTP